MSVVFVQSVYVYVYVFELISVFVGVHRYLLVFELFLNDNTFILYFMPKKQFYPLLTLK